MSRLINIGYGNMINSQKIIAVVNPDGAPIRRMVQNAKGSTSLIDASQGRKTKSVIIATGEMIILSALQPETILKRFNEQKSYDNKEDDNE